MFTMKKVPSTLLLIFVAVSYVAVTIYNSPTINNIHSSSRSLTGTPPTTPTITNNIDNTPQSERVIPSRAWTPWKSSHPLSHWCVNPNYANPSNPRGLIYVRIPKTASTTLSGIVMRIARRNSHLHGGTQHKTNQPLPCEHYWKHGTARESAYLTKNPQSFMFASVRNPTNRAVSQVFYRYMTKKNYRPDDDFIIEKLRLRARQVGDWTFLNGDHYRSKMIAGYQTTYTYTRDKHDLSFSGDGDGYRWKRMLVRNIIADYDFLVVSERVNESLVVLKFLLDLDFKDILYLSSNISGKSYRYDNFAGTCTPVEKVVVTPKVGQFLASDEWKRLVEQDMMLFQSANKSLDETIDSIGRKKFVRALNKFVRLLALAREQCGDEAHWLCKDGVHDREKTKRSCEDRKGVVGAGCGFQCLDDLILPAME